MSQGIDALALREVFYTVDVGKAEAFKPADVEWILADIQKEFAFPEFNRNVRNALLESTARQVKCAVDTSQSGGGAGSTSTSTTEEQLASLHQHFTMLSTTGRFTEALPVAQRQLTLSGSSLCEQLELAEKARVAVGSA
eukprot:2393232-Pyramimonas_sp.AAC.1